MGERIKVTIGFKPKPHYLITQRMKAEGKTFNHVVNDAVKAYLND